MESFKVICKADGKSWETKPRRTKIVKKRSFFGLFSKSVIVDDPNWTYGPCKDEICIVYETYTDGGETYYKLKGYGKGGYDSKWFIRLDEIEETQKEIAIKAEISSN